MACASSAYFIRNVRHAMTQFFAAIQAATLPLSTLWYVVCGFSNCASTSVGYADGPQVKLRYDLTFQMTDDFLTPTSISGTGKATSSSVVHTFIRSTQRNTSSLTTFGKKQPRMQPGSPKNLQSGHLYIGRIARSSLRQHGFLVLHLVWLTREQYLYHSCNYYQAYVSLGY